MLGALETRWMAQVAKEHPQEFSAKHAAIIGYLFAHMNRETWECWPVQEDMAEACAVSVDTVQRTLKDLQKWEVIAWKQGGKNYANTYSIFEGMRANLQDLSDKGLLVPGLVKELKRVHLIR